MSFIRKQALDRLTPSAPRDGRAPVPRVLPLPQLHAAPTAFSFRPAAQVDFAQRDAIRDMAATLRSTRRPLPPLLVVATAAGWTVADGYLRLAAYKAAKWSKRVPVEAFEGSPREALAEAVDRNRRISVPLTNQQRQDAAWWLCVDTEGSRRQISSQTGVSIRQIGHMRATKRRLLEASKNPYRFASWWEARRGAEDEESEGFDQDAKVAELREKLGRTFGAARPHLVEPFAVALAHHYGGLADHLADSLFEALGRDPGGREGDLNDEALPVVMTGLGFSPEEGVEDF